MKLKILMKQRIQLLLFSLLLLVVQLILYQELNNYRRNDIHVCHLYYLCIKIDLRLTKLVIIKGQSAKILDM